MAVVSESHESTDEHGSDTRTYIMVWAALLVLTVLELTVSALSNFFGPELSTVVILVFTVAKAALVAAFFMHLLYERRRVFLTITVFILPILIVLPMLFFIIILPYYF